MLLTIMLADDHTLVHLGVIGHTTTMLSSTNDRVDKKSNSQIRQIIDASSCLRTAGASFVLLLQVNKYENVKKFNGNTSSSSSSLIKSMISLEKQLKGYIDMMIIHDNSIKNITDINNELYRLHNIRSSSSSSSISKNNGTMNSTSTMTPIMALRDQLGVINLRRRTSSSSKERITSVETNIISF
jgi:hypothetical protein